jgi:hypothetical protein
LPEGGYWPLVQGLEKTGLCKKANLLPPLRLDGGRDRYGEIDVYDAGVRS